VTLQCICLKPFDISAIIPQRAIVVQARKTLPAQPQASVTFPQITNVLSILIPSKGRVRCFIPHKHGLHVTAHWPWRFGPSSMCLLGKAANASFALLMPTYVLSMLYHHVGASFFYLTRAIRTPCRENFLWPFIGGMLSWDFLVKNKATPLDLRRPSRCGAGMSSIDLHWYMLRTVPHFRSTIQSSSFLSVRRQSF